MKTIVKEISLYDFNELNEDAKNEARNKYQKMLCDVDIFYDDIIYYLKDEFPNSDLKVQYSLGYCQGDGLNIYGKLNLFDYLEKWDKQNKDKRTIEFYLKNSDCDCYLSENNRYSYSLKNQEDVEEYLDDILDDLEYQEIRNIKRDLLECFIKDMLKYMEELDKKFENDGYDYFYEFNDEDVQDWFSGNGIMFLKDGTLYYD